MRTKKIAAVAVICICAALFTVTGVMARYNISTTATTKTTVATFAFAAEAIPNQDTATVQIADSGSTAIGELSISNVENGKVSEVKQEYSITLTADEPVPAAMAPELIRNGKTYYATTVDSERKTFEFTHSDFQMEAEVAATDAYTIGLSWLPAPSIETKTLNFTIKVVATQID